MTTERATLRYRAQRASCVALFTCAGFSLGVVGRVPAYGVLVRLVAPTSPDWERIGWFLLRHDNQIGRASLVLGTVLGLLAGILVVRACGRRTIPRTAFVLGTLCFCVPWILFLDFKLLAVPAWIGAVAVHFGHLRRRVGGRRVVAVWVLFGVLALVPLDVSVADYPGPPRFVRVSCGGDYSTEGYRAARAGEFFLDGLSGRCAELNNGTWILIW